MDSKFYVSLEAARLLKEKGYDIKRDFLTPVYNENGCLYWSNHEDLSDKIPAITKAEAIDWLESKGIIIELSVTHNLCHWVFSIYMKGGEDILTNTDFDFESFTTRLEAEEAAIINASKLL